MPVQIIDFRPHTWETWQAEYRAGIRCIVEWDKLKRPKLGVRLEYRRSYEDAHIYYPWRQRGSWMDSKDFKKVVLKDSPLLIRVPAVSLKDFGLLVLDGNHRIKALTPWALIMDIIYLREGDERYFADLREVVKCRIE